MLLDDPADLSSGLPSSAVRGVDQALALAPRLTAEVPQPGSGGTLRRWDLLARLAATDLVAARVVEAHLDAVAILAEAQATVAPGPDLPHHLSSDLARHLGVGADATWGVYAAEGPQSTLTAGRGADGSTRLTGTKPWCSLAGRLSHALVTARTGARRQLYAVRLGAGTAADPARAPGVTVRSGGWHSRGLAAVPSEPVELADVLAVPVGSPGWYLDRPGFAHGGLGVAACWYGGLVGLATSMRTAATRRAPDQLALWHLGATDLDVHVARCVLTHASTEVDAGRATGPAGKVLALRARSVVAGAAERTLTRSGHAGGPGPLTFDDQHAQRVADLTVYLRQHHAERDVAALGAAIQASPAAAADRPGDR